MGAIGLTAGQWGLGSTRYNYCVDLSHPHTADRIVHEVPLSTLKPTTELGLGAIPISFTTYATSATLASMAADIQTKTERKFSFLLGATEVYYKVKAGSWEMVKVGTSGGNELYQLKVEFLAHDTNLYKASDDSVLVAG